MRNFKIKIITQKNVSNLNDKLETKYYKINDLILKTLIFNNEIFNAEFIENNENIKIELINFSSINLVGTPFQIKVWQALLEIRVGKTVSYQDIANLIGKPKAIRAVANAIANNKIAYFIPCHRVVRKDGQIGGYRWGIEKKKKLLSSEAAI